MNISVSTFKGTVPLIQPRLMKPEYAQTSMNARYESGSLVPYNRPLSVEALDAGASYKTIFKYATSASSYTWLRFDVRVFLAYDPIFSDVNNRMLITGLDAPRIFDITTLGSDTTVDATNSYLLGLSVPAQPTIAVSGSGLGTPESRAYVVQYDRHWSDGKIDAGPWSAPGVTSASALYVDVRPAQSVIVSNIADAPAGYGITHITVNRSASSTTATQYQYVFTFDIADAKAGTVAGVTWNSGTSKFTYTDTVVTSDLGSVSTNQFYTAPPAGIEGMVSINNGILAAYDDNYIYFSEPFQCHAWPDSYKIAIDRNVVGLGSYGNTLVVCTDAEPHLIQVSDPASAIASPIKEIAPCVSKYGIVSFRDAVVYPSYEGFFRIDSAGIANITASIADSGDLTEMAVDTMDSVGFNNTYYGAYTDANNQKKILVLNMASPDFGFGTINSAVDCMFVDKQSSTIYIVYKPTTSTYSIGAFNKSEIPYQFLWRSKVFVSEDDTVNFSAARLRFKVVPVDTTPISLTPEQLAFAINTHAYNVGPINGYALSASAISGYVVFNMYADGELVFSRNVYDGKPFRLPAGYIASTIEFEISGYTTVYEIDISTSMSELSSSN